MSNINTGSMNTEYPVPGVQNSSQGFRDNFTSIKNNLDIAASEITEIQSKAVLKSALTNVALENDMANTLISNALVKGFRATTYNLGNNISGTVTINVNNGDVQYGTITGDVSLGFTNWAPNNTQSNVKVILNIPASNAGNTINFPTSVDSSKTTLENYNSGNVTVSDGVTQLQYNLSTIDGGTSITVEPLNRPRKVTQLISQIPASSIGSQGDQLGTVATDGSYLYVCTADYNGSTAIWKRIATSTY